MSPSTPSLPARHCARLHDAWNRQKPRIYRTLRPVDGASCNRSKEAPLEDARAAQMVQSSRKSLFHDIAARNCDCFDNRQNILVFTQKSLAFPTMDDKSVFCTRS